MALSWTPALHSGMPAGAAPMYDDVGVGCTVGVAVASGVGVCVGLAVAVGVGVAVGVKVGVHVGVAVGVDVGVAVAVGVGVGVGGSTKASPAGEASDESTRIITASAMLYRSASLAPFFGVGA